MIRSLRKWDTSLILFAPFLGLVWLIVLIIIGSSDGAEYLRYVHERWMPFYPDLILGGLLLIASAFLTNRVVQNSVLLGRISNFPMFFLIILLVFIPISSIGIDGGLLLLIQVPFLRYILDLPEGRKTASLAFVSGLIIGLMAFVEPWSVLLAPLVLQAMLSTGLLDLRKLLIHLLGILTPFYLINAMLYLFGLPFEIPEWDVAVAWSRRDLTNWKILVQVGVIVLLGVFTLGSVFQISSHSTLREKRKWYLVVSYAFLGVLAMVFIGFDRGLYLLLVPSSIIFGRLFLTSSNLRALNVAFLVLITLLVLSILLGSS